jgi:hypothetical protein
MTLKINTLPAAPLPTLTEPEAIVYRLSVAPATCICCDQLADPEVPGDLDLCAVCYNILAAPWPDELPEPLY